MVGSDPNSWSGRNDLIEGHKNCLQTNNYELVTLKSIICWVMSKGVVSRAKPKKFGSGVQEYQENVSEKFQGQHSQNNTSFDYV